MDKLEKNKAIAASIKETYAKRKMQDCKCFKFKVDKSSLSREQSNQLKMQFVEAKWIYNYLLDKDVYTFDYKNLDTIMRKDKHKNDVEVKIQYLKSSVKQSIIQDIINQIKGLSALKKNGFKVGKLKHKSEYKSINLKQYNVTHAIRGNKIKIQGIKKAIRVRGLDQLDKHESVDYANAKLIYDGNDYFIALTCFIDKQTTNIKQYKNDIVGIDMGVSTTLALSDGTKYDVSVGESEKLKKLQSKLNRQQKGSNNSHKTKMKIRKEYIHMMNKKNDISNKIVHSILSDNKIVVIQDEQIAEWKKGAVSGSKVQQSILGRVKTKLSKSDRVVMLDKWFPTTKYCDKCRTKVNLELKDRIFECPNCKEKEDRDIHAAKNMTWFYLQYDRLDRHGICQTSKKPVKISYNKFVSLSKQEDTTSLALY